MTLRVYRFTYRPRPPFTLSAHLERFTAKGRPSPWLYDWSRKEAWRLIKVGGRAAGVIVGFRGEPWDPELSISVVANSGCIASKAYGLVLRMLRVDFDYNTFVKKLEAFPRLRQLAEAYPGLRPGRCLSLYNALVDAIVKQRVALSAAIRAMSRLVERFSPSLAYGGRVFYDYPLPENLSAASVDEIRACGLTRVKARALREVALAEVEGRLPGVEEVERDLYSVVGELQGIYGVGPWTAELAVAMVHSGFPIGPRADLAVRRGLQKMLGLSGADIDSFLKQLGDIAGLVMYLAAYSYEARGR